LALFGRRPQQPMDRPSSRQPKTCTQPDIVDPSPSGSISTGNIASDGEMDCLYRERYSRLMGQDEAYPITSKSQ